MACATSIPQASGFALQSQGAATKCVSMWARPDLLPLHKHVFRSCHSYRAAPNFNLLQRNHHYSRSSSHVRQPLEQTLAHLHSKLFMPAESCQHARCTAGYLM